MCWLCIPKSIANYTHNYWNTCAHTGLSIMFTLLCNTQVSNQVMFWRLVLISAAYRNTLRVSGLWQQLNGWTYIYMYSFSPQNHWRLCLTKLIQDETLWKVHLFDCHTHMTYRTVNSLFREYLHENGMTLFDHVLESNLIFLTNLFYQFHWSGLLGHRGVPVIELCQS